MYKSLLSSYTEEAIESKGAIHVSNKKPWVASQNFNETEKLSIVVDANIANLIGFKWLSCF